jgi:hypothetical protein
MHNLHAFEKNLIIIRNKNKQREQQQSSNKNVNIKFSAHDVFLE